MKKLIIANWKLNPDTRREARELIGAIKRKNSKAKNADIVVCPPTLFIVDCLDVLGAAKSIMIGAQDISLATSGAFTGSTSPLALKRSGVAHTIIGHSERRAAGETDEIINEKIKLALKTGLRVILCVGETNRDDHGEYLEILRQQIEGALADVPKAKLSSVIIAYEPVWAIGSKAVASDTPEGFATQALYIRKIVSGLFGKNAAHDIAILYGGSVDAKNARDFLEAGSADGLLVGRASLRADIFTNIILATEPVKTVSKTKK